MKKILALVLCLTALLCAVAMAEAPAPVYTEDFEDGVHDLYFVGSPTDAEKCVVVIAEEDGNKYLHCLNSTGEGENGYIQLAFGPELRNFDYTIRVRPYIKNPDHNWMKIVLRGLDGIKYSCDGHENESYLFNIWEWRGVFTIKSLSKKYAETVPMVENQDFWFDNDTWYTIKVEARDTNFKIYVDGELCADYTDAEDVIKWGVFGLCSWGANFDVDDISIISYDDPDMTYGNYNIVEEAAEEAPAAPVGTVNLLPLIKAEAGVFNHNEDGSVQVWGRTADGAGDAYTDSWHILGRKIGDFELNFNYNTQKTEWMQDRVCFRCAADENGWNQYQVLICGSNLGDNAAGIRIVKGEAYDHAYAYYPCTFEAGKNYEFKLVVVGNNVKLAMNGEQIIDVDLPTEGGEYYKDYIPEGDFQIITWGGDFTMDRFDVTEIVADDGVTDLLPLIKAEAGVFNHNEDGSVQVWGRTADGAGDAYTDSWHMLGRKVSDFELTFDYNTQKTEWMQDRVCFRCAADENGWNQYQILICGSNLGADAAGIRIVKGEAYDHAYAFYPCTFEAGKAYEFKLTVVGNNVKLAMNGEQIIDVNVPMVEGGEYFESYIPEGDFQIITWGGDFTISHMELVEAVAE